MTGRDGSIDPNLKQVLEDLSRDSSSSRFVADPGKILTGLADGSLQVNASRARLKPVERHLLQVHRHEVGWLLREAYLSTVFYSGSRSGLLFQGKPRDSREVREAARACLRRPLQGQGAVLARFARPTSEQDYPSGAEILAASLAIQDAPNARIYLAYHLMEEGQYRAAEQHAKNLLQTPVTSHHRVCALECIGAALGRSGETRSAVQEYERAYAEARRVGLPERSVAEPLLQMIRLFLQSREESGFLAAVKELEALRIGASQLRSAGERLSRLGMPSLHPEARKMVQARAASIDDEVMEFLNALV